MKAVLLSVKPKYCELIANNEHLITLRKVQDIIKETIGIDFRGIE